MPGKNCREFIDSGNSPGSNTFPLAGIFAVLQGELRSKTR